MSIALAVLSIAVVALIALVLYIFAPNLKAWWKGWSGPSQPIETFFDDPREDPKHEASTESLVNVVEKAEQDRRMFWLEQEFSRVRTQLDQFHNLKSSLEELRGLLKKVESDGKGDHLTSQHRIGAVEVLTNKLERRLDSISSELSSVIDSTKKFQSTLEHILKTRVSEENFAPLKQTVGRHDTDLSLLNGRLKKLEAGAPYELARLTELFNELKREHTGTRSIVNTLQGARFDTQTSITNRISALEQAQTVGAKLFDAAKQSADIKNVAAFEGREAAKAAVEVAKAELSGDILKKFVVEVQEVFDRRYQRAKPTPKTKSVKAPKVDAASAEKKSVEAFIEKAKTRNEVTRTGRRLRPAPAESTVVQPVKILV